MVAVSGLWIYPVKSCAGLKLDAAELTHTGLAFQGLADRHWMAVDENARFLTQRQVPQMALIAPRFVPGGLELSAPGAGTLRLAYSEAGPRVAVEVWRDSCAAYDCGDEAADWFSQATGRRSRLVAFDESVRRVSDTFYTGETEGYSQFSDGFAMLVISDASLNALNERLLEKGTAPVTMDRFRPNITIDGVEAFEEDYISQLQTDQAVLRLVKPCARCIITTVDPRTGERDAAGEPLATLHRFRLDAKAGTLFGQNAIVASGAGTTLRMGEELAIEWNF